MRFAEVLSWRWTPAFALVGGSLVFVLLAIALVPDQLGPGPSVARQPSSSASGHGRFGRAAGSASATSWGGHFTPAAAAAAAAPSAAENAPQRPERRVRRALAPGETPPYLDHTMSRLFNRGIPRPEPQDAPPEGAAAPVPAAPAPEPPQNTEAQPQPAPTPDAPPQAAPTPDAPPQGQGAAPNAEAAAPSAPN